MLKKQNIDSIVFITTILLIGFLSSNMSGTDFFKTSIHLLLIILIGLNNKWPIIVNFIVIFMITFVAFSFDPGTVDWTSYLLYAILSTGLSLLFCVGIYLQRQNTNRDPLKGTMLKWLLKKWPDLSGVALFVIDSIISLLLAGVFFFIVFQQVTIYMILVIIFAVCYFSASNIYFYIVKPRKERL